MKLQRFPLPPEEEPVWSRIKKCQVWPTLGVTECDGCHGELYCWGTNSQLLPNSEVDAKIWEEHIMELFLDK